MTDISLSEIEIRILGCLIEKEITTPEYYPLTLNSLTTACNQKTNRDPVVEYGEDSVREAVEGLLEKNLVLLCGAKDGRVAKYDDYFADTFHLTPAQTVVMCILMLRGPQTPGEIRGRAERLYAFESINEVQAVLDELASREEGALVMRLAREPGRREACYTHLLGGAPEVVASEDSDDRLSRMEEQLEALRQEVDEIRQQFLEFRRQFE